MVRATGLQLIRRGRSPLLLIAGAALILLAFWLWANQPEPKRERTPDPLQGPIEGRILYPTPRSGTYTLETTSEEIFDPGTSALAPRAPVFTSGSITEAVLIRGLEYRNFRRFDNNAESLTSYQTIQTLTFQPLQFPFGGAVDVGETFARTTGAPGTAAEGSSLTITSRRRVSQINIGGETIAFPAPVPGPGQPIPEPEPQALPATPAVPTRRLVPVEIPGETTEIPGQEGNEEGAEDFAPQRAISVTRFFGPRRSPVIPAEAQRLDQNGRVAPAPVPPIPQTGSGTTFLPGGISLPDNGPRPTPQGTATELGKLEQKLELLLAPEGPTSLLDKINRIIDQVENIKFVVDSLFPPGPYTFEASNYELSPVCETDGDGNPLPPQQASWDGGEGEIVEVNRKLDALAQLIQYHKNMKQPTCGGRGNGPGSNVTVQFESV